MSESISGEEGTELKEDRMMGCMHHKEFHDDEKDDDDHADDVPQDRRTFSVAIQVSEAILLVHS